mmetsp:Transcript_67509/g.159164  ORF Transcript_67509/g.159164 Transcript_67509/m.159164 type:complete len:246 (+) Transcript_67509:1427-2164(+)
MWGQHEHGSRSALQESPSGTCPRRDSRNPTELPWGRGVTSGGASDGGDGAGGGVSGRHGGRPSRRRCASRLSTATRKGRTGRRLRPQQGHVSAGGPAYGRVLVGGARALDHRHDGERRCRGERGRDRTSRRRTQVAEDHQLHRPLSHRRHRRQVGQAHLQDQRQGRRHVVHGVVCARPQDDLLLVAVCARRHSGEAGGRSHRGGRVAETDIGRVAWRHRASGQRHSPARRHGGHSHRRPRWSYRG